MLFMVIETFMNGDPRPIRERFLKQGRLLPDGVVYHVSWIDPERARCFQVMEADTVELLEKWIAGWSDLIEFEVVPVVTSPEYWARFANRPAEP
jgi:hypothetical protein